LVKVGSHCMTMCFDAKIPARPLIATSSIWRAGGQLVLTATYALVLASSPLKPHTEPQVPKNANLQRMLQRTVSWDTISTSVAGAQPLMDGALSDTDMDTGTENKLCNYILHQRIFVHSKWPTM
jgi:hypothetical protein